MANGKPDRRQRFDQAKVREVIADIRRADSTIAQGAREVGCHPNYLGRRVWNETRKDVLKRDGGCCVRCSGEGTDAHHRIARGFGGSSLPRIAFGMDNLITLCRTCHGWVHGHPEKARESGWSLLRTQDPADHSVVIRSKPRWLTADGQYADRPEAA